MLLLWLWPAVAAGGIRGSAPAVEAAGVSFAVTAEAIPVGPGWGLHVTVEATSADGQPHGIDRTPLSFGWTIQTGRTRVGFGEIRLHASGPWAMTLVPGEKTTFSRRQLGLRGDEPLVKGERLVLHVQVVAVEGPSGTVEQPTIATVRLDVPDEGPPLLGFVAPEPP